LLFYFSDRVLPLSETYRHGWLYTHNHYNIPTNHNVHINHIHIIHENIQMLALGTEAQPINKSIKITQHNMNTLCPPTLTNYLSIIRSFARFSAVVILFFR
jgi:hypothetical protein